MDRRWLLLLFCVRDVLCQTRQNIDDLYRDILNSSYNTRTRPNNNQSEATVIDLEFRLLSLVDIDPANSRLSVIGYLRLEWTDPRLTWDPLKYGTVTSIPLPRDKVWKPEIIVTNPASHLALLGPADLPIRITYEGRAIWNIGDLMEVTCKYDVFNFPFDKHTCTIMLYPVGTLTGEIAFKFERSTVDTISYMEHGEWDLASSSVSFKANRNEFALVHIDLTLARRWEFFINHLFAPILIMLHLNAFVFLLPADSGERIGYAMTCLLSTAVFLTVVNDGLPSSSRPVSGVTYFLLCMLLLSTTICLLNIISLRCYFANPSKPVSRYLLVSLRLCRWENVVNTLKCSHSDDEVKSADVNTAELNHNETDLEEQKTASDRINHNETDLEEQKTASDSQEGLTVEHGETWRHVGHFLDKIFFVISSILALVMSMIFIVTIASQ